MIGVFLNQSKLMYIIFLNDSEKPPNRIPYPVAIAIVLFGCTLVFSLIAFAKGAPSSLLAAIAKSGFTAAFSLIFVSEIGDKVMIYKVGPHGHLNLN